MPAATSVAPGRWSGINVLYDDGEYSVIAGDYDGRHRLGERWNGAAGRPGFPNQGGHPLYHVTPDFLTRPILHALLERVVEQTQLPNRDQYIDDIVAELRR